MHHQVKQNGRKLKIPFFYWTKLARNTEAYKNRISQFEIKRLKRRNKKWGKNNLSVKGLSCSLQKRFFFLLPSSRCWMFIGWVDAYATNRLMRSTEDDTELETDNALFSGTQSKRLSGHPRSRLP